MLIQTKYFGEHEIDEDRSIFLPQGLLGLEEYKNYAMFEMPDSERIMCLQCIDEPLIAFIVMNPWEFYPDYDIVVSDEELAVIGIAKVEELAVFNILTIGDATAITANLLAPIVINVKTRDAMQIVLNEDKYMTKHVIPKKPCQEQRTGGLIC